MASKMVSPGQEEARRFWRIVSIGLIGFLAVIVVVVGLTLFFHATASGPWYGYPFFFGFGWFWIILVFFLAFWFIRWSFWSHPWNYTGPSGIDAVSIARERYASGAITKEEFDRIVRDLREGA